MSRIRKSVSAGVAASLVAGCFSLTLLSGCEGGSQTPEVGAVKDAPPMTPEQQAGFDKAYKNKSKSK